MKKERNKKTASLSKKAIKKNIGKPATAGLKRTKSLTGYPHYPQKEDIMGTDSPEKRIDADVEELPTGSRLPRSVKENKPAPRKRKSNPDFVPGTEADVTREDVKNLGNPDFDLDEGEDELLLPNVKIGPDLWGSDLDVPGAELDDDMEDIGEEDEENNYYSRGQD